jgi:hypothetical protein
MMRIRNLLASAALVVIWGCSDDPAQPFAPDGEPTAPPEFSAEYSPDQVPPREDNHWARLSAQELWDHIAGLDSTLVVGLKNPEEPRGFWLGEFLLDETELAAARNLVESVDGAELIDESEILPLVDVEARGPEVIEALRALPVADYVEPGLMDIQLAGTKGCEFPAWSGPADTTQWGDTIPPHYTRDPIQVHNAWNRSQGADVVVDVTDTGISYYQNHLNDGFASGQSTGRWDFHTSVLSGDGSHPAWHDQCGHGTRTAGVPIAPMNGGNIVGVAWRSDL